MDQGNFAADGLHATLGGVIVHDEEIGIRQEIQPDGSLRMTLPHRAALTSLPAGGIGTGPLVTLLDTICGVTALHRLAFRESTATLDLRIDYLRPTDPGQDLVATARATHLSGTTGRGSVLVSATARHPGQDAPVATANGRFFRKILPAPTAPHSLHSDTDITKISSYQDLMRFSDLPDGGLLLPFRTGLIGNGGLPSLHGGIIAAHLQEAALRRMAVTRTPHLATAHVTFQTYGTARDLVAQARVEKSGGAVSFVAATSSQGASGRNVASALFTFVAS